MAVLGTWLIWTIVAVVMIVAEVFISGFFIVWFGVGAIPALVASLIWPKNITLQLFVYLVSTIVLLLSTRKIANRLYKSGSQEMVGANRLINKPGVVIEDIINHDGKGLVRVEHEQWRAQADGDEQIAKGEKVEVLRVDGTKLVVKRQGQ